MRKHACAMVFVLALAAVPASAEEVLYFTNGSQLLVATHWVEDGMIHVDIGGNGYMAFPAELVEKIDADTKFQLKSSSSAARGQMASSRGGAGRPVPQRPAPLPVKISEEVETDKFGMAVRTPLAGQGRAAERLKQYVLPGRGTVAGSTQRGGIRGAEREGNHHVIDSGQRIPKKRLGVERRYGGN